ncbi:MAG: thermonuclease family protein [Archaeoglobaceae archaeon]
MRKIFVFIGLLMAIITLASPIILELSGIKFVYLSEYLSTLKPDKYDTASIVEHVDGDTIKVLVSGKQETIRLIGVDTPETVHPSRPVSLIERFGKAASLFTQKLLPKGSSVLLTYDWNSRDSYGRLLAYVWFKATWQDQEYLILHNVVLILNGFGYAYTTYPFREDYMQIFREAEKIARENQLGLWGQDEEKVIADLEKNTYSPSIKPKEIQITSYSVKIVTISPKGANEYVVIKNVGSSPVNLRGWRLYSAGGQWYTFPSITLNPGQSVSVHSGPQASGPLVWTTKYVWNDKGDKAILYDTNNAVIDTYEY